MRFPLIAALACAATPAMADLGSDCLEAAKAGNDALVRRYADMILFSAGKLSEDHAAKAGSCLQKATGQAYVYVPAIRKFELAEAHAEAEKKRQEQAAEREAEERAATKAERTAALAAAKAEEEDKSRTERVQAQIASMEAERHQAVAERLSEGCRRMYRRGPDATITNKLCFDLFWERGLPD